MRALLKGLTAALRDWSILGGIQSLFCFTLKGQHHGGQVEQGAPVFIFWTE